MTANLITGFQWTKELHFKFYYKLGTVGEVVYLAILSGLHTDQMLLVP